MNLNVYKSCNKKKIKKYKRQRIKKGFCDLDTNNFSEWFLNIIPKMLKEILQKQKESIYFIAPLHLKEEFYKNNKTEIDKAVNNYIQKLKDKNITETPEDVIKYNISYGVDKQITLWQKRANDYANQKYNQDINKIIYLLEEYKKVDSKPINKIEQSEDIKNNKQQCLTNAFNLLEKYFEYFYFE